MNKEKRFEIKVNQEDVQNIINCYEKDIEYIKQLEQQNKKLHNKIDKAIELNREIDKSLRMKNTSAYIQLEDIIFKQWKMLKKDSDVDD